MFSLSVCLSFVLSFFLSFFLSFCISLIATGGDVIGRLDTAETKDVRVPLDNTRGTSAFIFSFIRLCFCFVSPVRAIIVRALLLLSAPLLLSSPSPLLTSGFLFVFFVDPFSYLPFQLVSIVVYLFTYLVIFALIYLII